MRIRRSPGTPADYIPTMRRGCGQAATSPWQQRRLRFNVELDDDHNRPAIVIDKNKIRMGGVENDVLTTNTREGIQAGEDEGGVGWDPLWSSVFYPPD